MNIFEKMKDCFVPFGLGRCIGKMRVRFRVRLLKRRKKMDFQQIEMAGELSRNV